MLLFDFLNDSGFFKNEEEKIEYNELIKFWENENKELEILDVNYFQIYSSTLENIVKVILQFFESYLENKELKKSLLRVFVSLIWLEWYSQWKILRDALSDTKGRLFSEKNKVWIENNNLIKNLHFCNEEDIEILKKYFLKVKGLDS